MICFRAKRQILPYLDGRLRGREHQKLAAHLRECDSCSTHFEQSAVVRSTLRAVPAAVPPERLTTALRVIASRECQIQSVTRGSRFEAWLKDLKFRFDQMMRPLTVPATGGLLSSLILFGVFALTLGSTTRVVAYEVPVVYENHMDANLVPFELRSKAVIVNMSLDGNGRIRDYSVGEDGSLSVEGNLAQLQFNTISMPEFPSVLALAHPITGDIRISFTPLALRP